MRYRALCLALVIVATWPTAAKSLGLSPTQLERLARGEVVLLDVLPPGSSSGPVQGGTAPARVQASPAAVWRVLVDYRHHPGLYPRAGATEAPAGATRIMTQ